MDSCVHKSDSFLYDCHNKNMILMERRTQVSCNGNKRNCSSSTSRSRGLFWTSLLALSTVAAQFHNVSARQSPPLIVKQPPTDELLFQVVQRVDENQKPFIIECEAEGYPEPRYKWIKNGKDFNYQTYDKRISQQPGRGTLVVTEPGNEDIGQYQCYAINEHGTATSNSVFVRKAELNSFKDEEIETIATDEGKPFQLPCSSPDGWPKPRVYWMLQSQLGALQSINSSRITVDPEGTLWFSNVTRDDKSAEFNYACTAYSPFRNEYKLGNRIYLNVAPTSSSAALNKHRPTIQYMTKRVTVAQLGQSIELWCIVGGTPLPEIKWSKKGSQLPYDRLEYDNYGKTIRILDVQFSDEGSYDCDATNGVGSPISYSITLQVNAAPYFTVEPELTNAAEGETVEFKCEAHGRPAPEIKWIHNGKPIEEAAPNPRRVLDTNKITLRNIIRADTGNYGCNASNSFGYVYKDVYVNVLALPPEITDPPKDVVTTESKNVIMTCRVFGAPKPFVRWIHNDQELTGGRFKVLDNGDLEIHNVVFLDAGSYRCFAENKFGNDSKTGNLVVKVATKIVFKPIDYEVPEGTAATFRCSATSDPTLTLTIEWMNDGELIDFESEPRYAILQDNSLNIHTTTELDTGIYTCVAKTAYDNATASATLVVQAAPNRPELLNVDCGRKDARIWWKPMGDNRSPILYYTIQYNTSFTPDSWEDAFKDVPATETSYTVSMSPWANYTFRVIARNKIGPSVASTHSPVCNTPQDVPFKNPDNVKGDGTEPNNLRISWTKMNEIEQNAPKFQYRVQWKQDDDASEWKTEEITDWRTDELTIINQPTYRPYLIRIRAVNEEGESNVSPTIIRGFSGQDYPSEAPGNLTMLSKIDGKTALVGWNPVRPETLNGKFEGYKIQTWTESEGDENAREIMIKNDVTQAVVDKLIPASRNLVRVFAYNTAYNGPSSRTIEIVTDEGTPGAVEDLRAFKLGASSLFLRWEKPEQPNGVLVGYKILYEPVIKSEVKIRLQQERKPNITNPENLEAIIAELEPNTKYRIHVYAATKIGIGSDTFVEESTYDVNATVLAKPKFRWDHSSSQNALAAVKIIWMPDFDGEGRPGSHFYIQYKRFGETTFSRRTPNVKYENFYIVRGLDPGQTYIFRVVSVDGNEELPSDEQEIYTYTIDGPLVQAKESGGTTGWFIGLIVALAFLVLIIILVCIVKRNRGGKYAVYEREIAHGRLDYDEGGFREYSQPADPDRSGRTSMVSDFKPPHESDTDSMAEYGDEGKFTEDGSFIGQYGVKKKPDPNLPSPMATFV